MQIGFIGLGHMGGPMAINLVKAGHNVKVFDLSAAAIASKTEERKAKQAKKLKAARKKAKKQPSKKVSVRAVKPIVLGETKRRPGRPRSTAPGNVGFRSLRSRNCRRSPVVRHTGRRGRSGGTRRGSRRPGCAIGRRPPGSTRTG